MEDTLQHDKFNYSHTRKKQKSWLLGAATVGPGLAVMLADTDAGSILTSAQSGAQWGYSLLLLQILLVPILYFVQELTTRIGLTTGRGHGELIKEQFGAKWAWISVATLYVAVIGALVTEFSGIASAGLILGVTPKISVPVTALLLLAISSVGKYNRVETIAIAIGCFELVFLPAAILAHPDGHAMTNAIFGQQPVNDHSYWLLIAANVGAVIMPWMVFYQQGAVVDKGLKPSALKWSRLDTALGSILTQVVMAAILVLTAATIGKSPRGLSLTNIQEISAALTPYVGSFVGKVLFALGISGASIIAAIVVSLAASWAFGEVLGFKRSLNLSWKEAPAFYGLYAVGIIVASIVVLSGAPIITLSIAVEVMNTLLLPIVLGFLLVLGWKALPAPYRLKGWEKVVLIVIYFLVCSLGVYTLVTL